MKKKKTKHTRKLKLSHIIIMFYAFLMLHSRKYGTTLNFWTRNNFTGIAFGFNSLPYT